MKKFLILAGLVLPAFANAQSLRLDPINAPGTTALAVGESEDYIFDTRQSTPEMIVSLARLTIYFTAPAPSTIDVNGVSVNVTGNPMHVTVSHSSERAKRFTIEANSSCTVTKAEYWTDYATGNVSGSGAPSFTIAPLLTYTRPTSDYVYFIQKLSHDPPAMIRFKGTSLDQSTTQCHASSGQWYSIPSPQADIGFLTTNEEKYKLWRVANTADDITIEKTSGTVTGGDTKTAGITFAGTGDSNLDGQFSTHDLIVVFQAGKFETGEKAIWDEGDWNGDGYFTTADLTAAFQAGTYEQGPQQLEEDLENLFAF